MAQGWAQFQKTCSEVGAGELPQLLQYVKTHTTPTPTPTPMTSVKQEIKEEEEPMDVKSEIIIEKLIHISLGGKWEMVEYRCGNCNITPTRFKSGMDAHIRSVHTKKVLLCSCVFSTYNFDSLNRHMKEHN